MALQDETIPVSFDQGIDTKTDPFQVMPGKLLLLQNGYMQSPKKIMKRYGTVALPTALVGGGNISAGRGLTAYNNELDILDGNYLFSYSPAEQGWVNKGSLVVGMLDVSTIVRTTNSQITADSAYNASTNLSCYTYFDSVNGLTYSIVDNNTGMFLVNNFIINTNGTLGKVLCVGNYFVIIYTNTSAHTLYYYAINVNNPTAAVTPVAIATDFNIGTAAFDAEVINNSIYIVYTIMTTGYTGVYSLSSSLVLSAKTTISSVTGTFCYSIVGDASNNIWISGCNSTPNVYVTVLNSSFATLLSPTIISTTAATSITSIVSGTTGTFWFSTPGNPNCSNIRTNTCTLTGTTGTASYLIRGLCLASKAFSYGGSPYFLTLYYGTYVQNPANTSSYTITSIEPTYFLINGYSGAVISRIAGQNGPSASAVTNCLLTEMNAQATGKYSFAYLLQDDLSVSDGAIFFKTGVSQAVVNFNTTYAPANQTIASTLMESGLMTMMYDGANVVEHGFHLFPENLSQTTASSGGGIGPGLFGVGPSNQLQYVAVYEWADNYGQIHQSAPSVPLSVTLTTIGVGVPFTGTITQGSNKITGVASGSFSGLVVGQVLTDTVTPANLPTGIYITGLNQSSGIISLSANAIATASGDSFATSDNAAITVTVPTLHVTSKQNVSIALYRTAVNGTIFYRASSLTSLTYNSTSSDTVTFVDTLPDSQLIGNQQLYTTGGTVQNYPMPSHKTSTIFKNRMIAIPTENPNTFWYSQAVVPGSPVEFSADFVQNIDQRGGGITGCGVIDNNLILFKQSWIFLITGDGPAPNGTANDFNSGNLISADTGCINQNSIVLTADGLIFQSQKGLCLLDRSLNISYIGAPVEAYNADNVTSAQLVPQFNQIRFTLDGGSNLCSVYDYYLKQWYEYTNVTAIDSDYFQNNFTFLNPNGTVYVETPGVYTDNGSFIQLTILTGWFSFAGLQGFQRIREIELLGTYYSPHTLQVSVGVDFSSTLTPLTPVPVLSQPLRYQYRFHMPIQKCESMQFQIQDTQTSNFGEGFDISGINMEVAVKKGLDKFSDAQSYG